MLLQILALLQLLPLLALAGPLTVPLHRPRSALEARNGQLYDSSVAALTQSPRPQL